MSIWWHKPGGSKRVLYSASIPWSAIIIVLVVIVTAIVMTLASLAK